jgi:protein-L-isoaspartate(D-aspartate) O-methyltransferase
MILTDWRSVLIFFIIILQVNPACMAQVLNPHDFKTLRTEMVDDQILARGIRDEKVLSAMLKVERHRFVPEAYLDEAYEDHPLPIGEGQTISQPYIVAFMTEALDLNPGDKVLEIGTGSGYQAAVLAEICDSVFSIEIFPSLVARAEKVLSELGYRNIYIKSGDGYSGWPEHASFNAIIVTCAPGSIPKPLENQLAEGGKMIIPVGGDNIQELILLEKKDGKLVKHNVLSVRFVPMIDTIGNRY